MKKLGFCSLSCLGFGELHKPFLESKRGRGRSSRPAFPDLDFYLFKYGLQRTLVSSAHRSSQQVDLLAAPTRYQESASGRQQGYKSAGKKTTRKKVEVYGAVKGLRIPY